MKNFITVVKAAMRPTTLYHETQTSRRESIEREGICRKYSETAMVAQEMGEPDWEEYGGIFFSNKKSYRRLGFDCWKIDVTGLRLKRDDTTQQDISGKNGGSLTMVPSSNLGGLPCRRTTNNSRKSKPMAGDGTGFEPQRARERLVRSFLTSSAIMPL